MINTFMTLKPFGQQNVFAQLMTRLSLIFLGHFLQSNRRWSQNQRWFKILRL